MSRKPRIHRPAAFYHVMLRGNNGQDIFFSDRDRCRFCLLLQEGIERFKHRIHGFCLMNNHVHLIIQTSDLPLSPIMHHLASRYARYVNRTQHRIGHLFQGRFKAILVDAENYLSELIRYVHLNPVRAGIVAMPEDYFWSGHSVFVGSREVAWLSQEWILRKFHQYDISARALYAEYVKHGIGEMLRSELYLGTHEGRILGEDTFIEDIINELQSTEKEGVKISTGELVNIVANVVCLPLSILQSKEKRPEVAQARGIAALLVREFAHLSFKELGQILSKDACALSRLAITTQKKALLSEELAQLIKQVRYQIAEEAGRLS
jgi:putative transposase